MVETKFVTKYPTRVYQNGEKTIPWKDLDDAKTNNKRVAYTTYFKSKHCSNSHKICFTDFGFKIPLNHVVTGVQILIKYANGMPKESKCFKKHAMEIQVGNKTFRRGNAPYIPGTNKGSLKTWKLGGNGDLLGLSTNPEEYKKVEVRYSAIIHPQRMAMIDTVSVTIFYKLPKYTLSVSMVPENKVNEPFQYSLSIKNTNKIPHNHLIPLTIVLPSGVNHVSHKGTGKYDPSTRIGKVALFKGEGKINLTLVSNTPGLKSITTQLRNFPTIITNKINIVNPDFNITSNLKGDVLEGKDISYKLTIEKNISPSDMEVTVPLIEGFKHISSSGDGSYNKENSIWTIEAKDQKAVRTFTIQAVKIGKYTQKISIASKTVLTQTISILNPKFEKCFNTHYTLPPGISEYMQDGGVYTLSCYSWIKDSKQQNIVNGINNFRIAVIQGESESLGSRVSRLNICERIHVTFQYKKSNTPPIMKIYGQKLNESPHTCEVLFFGFAIHNGIKKDYEASKPLFENPLHLIESEEFAKLNIPQNTKSTPIRFYSINLQTHTKDPPHNIDFSNKELCSKGIIKGFAINCKCKVEKETVLKVRLNITDKNGAQYGQKSIISNGKSNAIQIGGDFDNWGLKIDPPLFNMNFIFQLLNYSNEKQTIYINNVQFVLFWQVDETNGAPGFKLNNEHSKNYSIFLKRDLDKPEGLNTKINMLELEKSSGALITGFSSQPKTIKLKFDVVGKDLKEIEKRTAHTTQWLSNELNDLKIPIPQKLVFDWDTKRQYNVILNEAVKTKYDLGRMECEAEFLVPQGTATGPLRTTGPYDHNNGLTKILPTLMIKTTGNWVSLFETYSEQEMILKYKFPYGTILTIDCARLTVKDAQKHNYSQYIALKSDWFILNRGKFDFSNSKGCVVQKITFREGL
jgi:hypothetical protein